MVCPGCEYKYTHFLHGLTCRMKEVDLFSTVEGAVQMIVANKIDMVGQRHAVGTVFFHTTTLQEDAREVSPKQGVDIAKRSGCLFVETSAKIDVAVEQAFTELVLKILQSSPQLTRGHAGGIKPSSATQRSTCC